MKKVDYERLKSSIENQKTLVEKGEQDLKQEFSDKGKYYNENKDFLNLTKDNEMYKKHKRGMDDFDSRIQFHKNTLEYRIQDAYDVAESINKAIEPYISSTDTMANVKISLFEQEKEKLNKEIEDLNKQKESFPEYDRTYREEGKIEYQGILDKIKEKENRISEINDEIELYNSRDELQSKYKENLKTMKDLEKMAEKYALKLPISKETRKKQEELEKKKQEEKNKSEEKRELDEHDKKDIENSEKNVFEKNNIINDVKEQMEQENTDYKNINLQDEELLKQVPKVSDVKSKTLSDIKYIEILEKDEKVHYKDTAGKSMEISTDIDKKELFKDLKISDICKELTESRISSWFLKRKINPNIVSVLRYRPKQLKEYITSLKDGDKLPFELVHNLEDISMWKKFRLNKFAKIEEKLGAKVLGKLFDKNKALPSADEKKKDNVIEEYKKDEKIKDKLEKIKQETLEENKYASVTPKNEDLKKVDKVSINTKYKVNNDGNIIENKVKKIMEDQQKQTANDVKKIKEEEQK